MRAIPKNEAGTTSAQPAEKLVRANNIAERIGVNKRTVELWAQKELVPSYRLGGTLRFDLDEVMAAMRKGGKP